MKKMSKIQTEQKLWIYRRWVVDCAFYIAKLGPMQCWLQYMAGSNDTLTAAHSGIYIGLSMLSHSSLVTRYSQYFACCILLI